MTVDIVQLLKNFGEHFTLHVPSLSVGDGEALGLVGNNGAGKTTFLRLLLDLIRADDGYALVNGHRVDADAAWKEHVGSYLDESFLLDFLRPGEFFQFTGQIYGLTGSAVEAALVPFTAFLPHEALRDDQPYIRDLSMGNKKKIGLVAALFTQPRLLILDEPFANLDPGSQYRLKGMLRKLRDERGTTMLISSHDLVHVTDICERIAILEHGRIARDIRTSDATLRELELYFADPE